MQCNLQLAVKQQNNQIMKNKVKFKSLCGEIPKHRYLKFISLWKNQLTVKIVQFE